MKEAMKGFIAGLIVMLTVLYAGPSWSTDKDGLDVVLVMDSSGSMKKTDPHSLRIPAAKLFISLLDKNDRAAVVSFTDKGSELITLTAVDTYENREKLMNAVDKISSDGLYTNLYEAFSSGYTTLSHGNDAVREKIIIVMSDGMMDVGDADKDRELMQKLKNSLAADLKSDDIRVYTIAFTEQSDRKLLEKISKKTGGFYNLALTDRDFHLIFTSIFESLKKPDMLPMSENGFVIDSSIDEVTIVATKSSPDTLIQINSPNGQTYTSIDRASGVGWFVSDNFDMITVNRPLEGRWEILFSTGENNKAYIITNLKLQSNFEKLYSIFGEPLDIEIWLEKEGSTMKEEEVLEKIDVYVEMTGPEGTTKQLKPFQKGEGIFYRRIAPFSAGNYKMRIIAKSMTFEREKSYVFNVANVEESKEDIKEMLAEREKEETVEEELLEDEVSDEILWGMTVFQFICINLFIGLVVFIYFKKNYFRNLVRKSRFERRIKRQKTQAGEGNQHAVDTAKAQPDSEAEQDRTPEEGEPAHDTAALPEEVRGKAEKIDLAEEAEDDKEGDEHSLGSMEHEQDDEEARMVQTEEVKEGDADGTRNTAEPQTHQPDLTSPSEEGTESEEQLKQQNNEDDAAQEGEHLENQPKDVHPEHDESEIESTGEGQKTPLSLQEVADLEGLLREKTEPKDKDIVPGGNERSDLGTGQDEGSETESINSDENIAEVEPFRKEEAVPSDNEESGEKEITSTEKKNAAPHKDEEEREEASVVSEKNEEGKEGLNEAWAEALTEQTARESGVNAEADETGENEEEQERLDKAWAEALTEQTSGESEGNAVTDETGRNEEEQECLDDSRAGALTEQTSGESDVMAEKDKTGDKGETEGA